MNKEVTFEIAKLLKEKGFSEKTLQAYVYRGVEHQDSSYKGRLTKDKLLCDISAPTIAEVVMWIYDNYGIWIYIKQSTARLGFVCFIQRLNTLGEEDIQNDERYTSSEEAYEAAIKYVLENLIQGGNK